MMFKRGVFALCLALVAPLTAIVWAEKRLTRRESWFCAVGQLLAGWPGYSGVFLRAAYYYLSLERCSWQVHIGFGTLFTHRGASLGAHVSTGAYCVIGHADIGNNVMLASRISIPSGKRQHFDETGRITSEPRFDRVVIESGCWIGEGAIVMADVGAGSIVSAGAVVTRRMPAGCLIAGNPAEVVRELKRDASATHA